jgi:hypothetical protein
MQHLASPAALCKELQDIMPRCNPSLQCAEIGASPCVWLHPTVLDSCAVKHSHVILTGRVAAQA